MKFFPKEGGNAWAASIRAAKGTGYDVSLFLDRVTPTSDSGWMLELGVEADGTISGQITAHPGYDALVVFTCSQDTFSIWENSTEPSFVVTDSQVEAPMTDKQKLAIAIRALRDIRRGGVDDGRWYNHETNEAVDGAKEGGPPEGCYDRDSPPNGYDIRGWSGDPDLKPADPLVPVEWMEFTAEEQTAWVDTCAWLAKDALEQIGVPLVEQKGGQ